MSVELKGNEPPDIRTQDSYFKMFAQSSIGDIVINIVSKVPLFGLIPYRDVLAFMAIGADQIKSMLDRKISKEEDTRNLASKIVSINSRL
jgi:hypothetical protein